MMRRVRVDVHPGPAPERPVISKTALRGGAKNVRIRNLLACVSSAAFLAGPATAASAVNDSLDLAQYKGRVVLLDFWASWCAPCKASFPWMQHLQQQYPRTDLVVLAVNVDHERGLADQFLQAQRPDFSVVFDPQGRIAERFDVHSMPASFYIDRSGRVRYTHAGFRSGDRDEAELEISRLVAEH